MAQWRDYGFGYPGKVWRLTDRQALTSEQRIGSENNKKYKQRNACLYADYCTSLLCIR